MKHSGTKYLKALVNLILALVILLLVIFLLPRLLVFFSPFVVGWIIALIASPFVRFFEEKVKFKRKWGSAVVIVVIIALVVLILYLVGAKLIREVMGLMEALPGMWKSAEEDFTNIAANLSMVYDKLPLDIRQTIANISEQADAYMGDFLSRISTPTLTAVGNFAKQLPALIIGVIMSLLSAYLFVAQRDQVTEWLRSHIPVTIRNQYMIIRRGMVKAVGGYLKAQLKIEFWMYLLLVIGLTILRVDYALLISFGIAILDFLPFFGTGTVMLPWAVIKILSADYRMAVGLLIIWGVGQLARQVIQPKIVGDSIGVPPLPTLLFLFIGFKVAGVVGMIVAVPMGLILITMYEEGVFNTTRNSVMILVSGFNRFRRLEREDMWIVEEEKRKESDK